ncbi:MAG: peptidoglycan recognition protein [Acidimicrobiia bacterium]
MRRLLLLPALALVLLGTPVLALEEPPPPSTSVEDVPVEPAAPVAPDAATPAAPDPAVPGWQSTATPIDSSIVGVKWDGDPAASFTIEARSSDGTWSPAPPVEAADLAADDGTKDVAPVAAAASENEHATDPVWIGEDATAVRVTVDEGTATDVTVAAVVDSTPPAPDGAAGAASGVLGPLDGTDKWLFGIALGASIVLLAAVAFGWSPWRARRAKLVAIGVGALLLASCVPAAPPPPPAGLPPAQTGDYPAVPAMVVRAGWGAQGFACGTPDYASSLKYAIVHHTVNSNNYSPGQSATMVRGIQAYHMGTLGYCDIAYNFLVDRFGTIFEGRDGGITKPVIGGHAGGFNTQSVGVAMLGDYTGAQPPGEQFNAVANLLRWRLSIAHVDPSLPFSTRVLSSPCNCQNWPPGEIAYFSFGIISHRDVDQTSCPGNAFYPRMGELRSLVQPGIRFPPGPPPA